MPRSAIDFMVLPNPYHTLDHDGRPAGVCPKERTPTTVGHQGRVGAELHATRPEKLPDGHQGTPAQETRWQFSKEPLQVKDQHGYYRQALRDGALFAADQHTHKMVFGAGDQTYRSYADALASAKARANADWRAAHNEDSPYIDVDPFADPFASPAPQARQPAQPASPVPEQLMPAQHPQQVYEAKPQPKKEAK